MRLVLDVPEWLARALRHHLEEEIRTLSDQARSAADLARVARQRQTLSLAVGQIDTQLEDLGHRFRQSMDQAYRRQAEALERRGGQ